MFKNYLKIALRNIKKHKGCSLINIFGLTTGFVCCIFILLYLQSELSYDTYHKDADRIYRVAHSWRSGERNDVQASNSAELVPALRENFPQVEYAVRINTQQHSSVKYRDRVFFEDKVCYADAEIFDVFTIPFLKGDPTIALSRPCTAVLTKHMADKYFDTEDPIGKIIRVDTTDFEITAILENFPQNTHLKFHIIMSFKTIEESISSHRWSPLYYCYTYIKLVHGIIADEFEKSISHLAHHYIGEELVERSVTSTNIFQPLKDIHLKSHLRWEIEPPGNPFYLYIFSMVGVLILLIAYVNFINLSTARSANRSLEVGMRKVIGAKRGQLVWQYIIESFLMFIIALLAAFLSADLFMPYFNGLANTQFTFMILVQPNILYATIGLILFIIIAAGVYPAFYLSALKPISVLKGNLPTNPRSISIRKVLVVGQFAISVFLIIGTIIVYRQLEYMKSRYLGFDRKQKLIMKIPRGEYFKDNYEIVKGEFLRHSSITGATASGSFPGQGMFIWQTWPYGEKINNSRPINILPVDCDFIQEYGLDVIAGRPFRKEMGFDSPGKGFILNKVAVQSFGWNSAEEVLSKKLWDHGTPVIGVIKDFHFKGLQNAIEPLGLLIWPEQFQYITLSVNIDNLSETLSFLEKKFRLMFPDDPMEYFFLDTEFNMQYQAEEQLGRIFSIFTFLGLFISCIGLFGLASFLAEQRTKEIGIRKVMGASVVKIIFLLSNEFTKSVLIANVIAWPIAYYFMNKWLQNFAYRIVIS